MDEFTRAAIAEAEALDDQVRRDEERHAWQRRQRHEQETASTDDLRDMVAVLDAEADEQARRIDWLVAQVTALRALPFGRDGRTIVGPRGEKGEPGPPGKDGVVSFLDPAQRSGVIDLPRFIQNKRRA